MQIQQAIAALMQAHDLSREDMYAVMQQIMTGGATDAQIGGFLVALQIKSPSVEEITAAAQVMRELSTKVRANVNRKHLVDTCGTGGSGIAMFNVSTASAFVVACAGGFVAKHGNRSMTSKSGSADLLEAAGANLDLSAEQVARSLDEIGIGFMYAINHHSAMKYASTPRKQLGVRTIFNILGPLTNPAEAPNQVLGVFNRGAVLKLAQVMKNLGSEHVLIVNADEGLDEISIAGSTRIAELKDGEIREYDIRPEDFGLQSRAIAPLLIDSAEQSLALVKQGLTDCDSLASDMIALNAGAAIYAANLCSTLAQGVDMARDVLGTGIAWEKMQDFIIFSQHVK